MIIKSLKGYSLITSVSMRRLPALGDDIFYLTASNSLVFCNEAGVICRNKPIPQIVLFFFFSKSLQKVRESAVFESPPRLRSGDPDTSGSSTHLITTVTNFWSFLNQKFFSPQTRKILESRGGGGQAIADNTLAGE